MDKLQYYFRLRELICAKYGEDRFALGCEITARWLNWPYRNTARVRFTAVHIEAMCAVTNMEALVDHGNNIPAITLADHESLSKLFNLADGMSIYTTP